MKAQALMIQIVRLQSVMANQDEYIERKGQVIDTTQTYK